MQPEMEARIRTKQCTVVWHSGTTESGPGMARGREPDNESGDDVDLRAR